jgi:hypothetical protein
MRRISFIVLIMLSLGSSGCFRAIEPVKIETIGTTEEGFLIPLAGDTKKQVSTSSEEFLRNNLVLTKQVRIPQQFIQTGRQFWYGDWRDAAVLIKVDRSPVTREWTADATSGTSFKNEAVWVMTADQVEFSTGWGITASINGRDNAIKFLYNYPNGVLSKVLDTEVRSKLQTTFGIEVTDLPMDKLRKAATPHITKTVDTVVAYFSARGITIMNLGITGGFVYKDPKIGAKIVEVFNAEQETSIAAAATAAQAERNKKVQLEAEAKAKALLTERTAEAQGILAVAEARKKETEVVQGNPDVYMTLRRMELEREKLQRWNGSFPTFFVGDASSKGPDFLLTVPAVTETKPLHRVEAAK